MPQQSAEGFTEKKPTEYNYNLTQSLKKKQYADDQNWVLEPLDLWPNTRNNSGKDAANGCKPLASWKEQAETELSRRGRCQFTRALFGCRAKEPGDRMKASKRVRAGKWTPTSDMFHQAALLPLVANMWRTTNQRGTYGMTGSGGGRGWVDKAVVIK